MKTKNIKLNSILIVFIIYAIIAFSLLTYNKYLQHNIWESTLDTLASIDEQQVYNFDSRLNQDIDTMKTYSSLLTKYQLDTNEEQIQNYLHDLAKNSHFKLLGYTDLDGNAVVPNININLSEYEYFQDSLKGETCIFRLSKTNDFVENQLPMTITSPLYSNTTPNEVIGVLFGIYKPESLDSMLISSMSGDRSVAIITNYGDIIAKSDNKYLTNEMKNITEYYNRQPITFVKGDNAELIFSNLYQNKKGFSVFTVNGEDQVLTYSSLDRNNWDIISIVNLEDLDELSNKIINTSNTLYVFITILSITLGTIIVISQIKYSKKMEKLDYYDKLTNAPTELKFNTEAEKHIIENKHKKKFFMVKFDVKNFRTINQISGYEVGNQILIAIANSLAQITEGKYQRYAKCHSDHFLVLHEYNDISDITGIKEAFMTGMLNELTSNFIHDFEIVSGIYLMSDDNCFDVRTAIERANIAHRNAKKLGVEIAFYESTLLEQEIKIKQIEDTMKIALQREDFKVYLQPKFTCDGTKIVGAEALVRWEDSVSGKTIFPNEFIPFFEENNFIQQLDLYMFEHVCRLIKSWKEQEIEVFPISINISRNSFNIQTLPRRLENISDFYNIDRNYLEIEITENALSSDVQNISKAILQLRQSGFRISMDDFSSQNSSLAFLSEVEVDTIKIDRSFVVNISVNPRNALLVSETIESLKNLGYQVVVEGIETLDQVEILKDTKCDIIQGYVFAKPMPADELTELLKK